MAAGEARNIADEAEYATPGWNLIPPGTFDERRESLGMAGGEPIEVPPLLARDESKLPGQEPWEIRVIPRSVDRPGPLRRPCGPLIPLPDRVDRWRLLPWRPVRT